MHPIDGILIASGPLSLRMAFDYLCTRMAAIDGLFLPSGPWPVDEARDHDRKPCPIYMTCLENICAKEDPRHSRWSCALNWEESQFSAAEKIIVIIIIKNAGMSQWWYGPDWLSNILLGLFPVSTIHSRHSEHPTDGICFFCFRPHL